MSDYSIISITFTCRPLPPDTSRLHHRRSSRSSACGQDAPTLTHSRIPDRSWRICPTAMWERAETRTPASGTIAIERFGRDKRSSDIYKVIQATDRSCVPFASRHLARRRRSLRICADMRRRVSVLADMSIVADLRTFQMRAPGLRQDVCDFQFAHDPHGMCHRARGED